MMELIQITNDPEFARRCDALEGMRLWVDLERMGKAERQAGRNTFISVHQLDDVARVKAVLQKSKLMVRVNPLNPDSATEVEQVLERGADLLMLPMFTGADDLGAFCALVAGRVPVVPLLETAQALRSVASWARTPGLSEIYVGLNDLHISLGCRFMFEPLAQGLLEPVAQAARDCGLKFGFGGIARLNEGLLPGRAVLGEHLRLGSQAVILSRTFHRSDSAGAFEDEVAQLRQAEHELAQRSAAQQDQDRQQVSTLVANILKGLPA